jgi:hypothetical protein
VTHQMEILASLEMQAAGAGWCILPLADWKCNMHACDSMAMLIGTAALSVSTTSAWPQALIIALRTDTGTMLSSMGPAPGACTSKVLLMEHSTTAGMLSQPLLCSEHYKHMAGGA